MCGIAGLSLPRGQKANLQQLQPLADALAHRGPNGEGFYAHAGVGLAHRRLSIIDVNGGAQPLLAPNHAIVVNGEVYNYKALQTLAVQGGARLATRSDSEPPLHRFAQIGEAAFDELQGMYALALVDAGAEMLHLAVDPFGIKQLYYAETGIGFIFASEPRAIIQSGWVRPQVNEGALPGLLNRHYSTGAETLFQGIYRVLPGERLAVRHGKIVARRRKLPVLQPAPAVITGADPVADFGNQLLAAVERHLQADVPYGILLSGGLDSTAVALAMKELGAPVHAYTAHVRVESGPNEAEAASELAKGIGAQHTTVTYDENDFWPALVDMAWAMDDLVTDYAALPLLKLTKRAAQDVRILLSGEGGDEMLAGYGAYRKKPSLLGWFKARRSGDAYPNRTLFRHPALAVTPHAPTQPWDVQGFSALQKRQGQDVAGWLPNDLLLKLDRTTMANGVEGRVPFLDDAFSAWAFALPDTLKVQPEFGKHIVREHLARKGYKDLAWARKQGFSVAVGHFLGQKPKLVEDLWRQSPLLAGLLQPYAAGRLLGGLGKGKIANLSFSLTLLALWHKLHVEGESKDSLAEALSR